MADDIAEKIEESALGPARVRSDGTEVEQHPIKDLIEADRYATQKTANVKGKVGFRIQLFVPPGVT